MSRVATKHCLVAVATQNSNVTLLDLKSGSKTHTLRGHRNSVMCAKWSTKDEFLLATGRYSYVILLVFHECTTLQ